MASTMTNKAKYRALSRMLGSDTFNMQLHTGSVPSTAVAQDLNAIGELTNEHAATGNYTTGGKAMTGLTVTEDDSANEARVTFTPLVWTNATLSLVTYAVVINLTVGGEVIAVLDLSGPISSTNADFTVTPSVSPAGWAAFT